MRFSTLLFMALVSISATAGGYTANAVPTKIDVVRDEGFMLFGEFANPGGCTFNNRLFVKASHPQYKQLYSLAIAAFMGKQKLSAYVHICEGVLWYSAASNTFNVVQPYASLAIAE